MCIRDRLLARTRGGRKQELADTQDLSNAWLESQTRPPPSPSRCPPSTSIPGPKTPSPAPPPMIRPSRPSPAPSTA
eukprot:3162479-Alexandrium_andersonii.AAC.1